MNDQLLIRFLNQECTDEEIKIINQWILLDKKNARYLFELERFWELKDEIRFSKKDEMKQAYAKVSPAINKEKKPRRISARFIYAAACFAALFISNIYFIYLANDTSGHFFHTIEVPKGQRAMLTLNDGSKIWVNSKSKLIYPSGSQKESREVSIDGEAYFEVAHNGKVPFVVNTNDLKIKVLGTKFNVKSYEGEIKTVSLKEGQVEVSLTHSENKIILKPGEQVKYKDELGELLHCKANTEMIDKWKDGEFYFYETSLEEIMHALERRFDTHITIGNDKLKEELFTCRMSSGSSLPEILNRLSHTGKMHYVLNDDHIIIYP